MAEEAGVRLYSSDCEPSLVFGDRDLLFDAISNVVDNAVQHGRNNGEVTVSVGCDGASLTLSIADRGPGIPLEERGSVPKRFYRLERSRSRPGNGLGLSLVAAVASVRQATIEPTDNVPGLKVLLHFPDPGQAVLPESNNDRACYNDGKIQSP